LSHKASRYAFAVGCLRRRNGLLEGGDKWHQCGDEWRQTA